MEFCWQQAMLKCFLCVYEVPYLVARVLERPASVSPTRTRREVPKPSGGNEPQDLAWWWSQHTVESELPTKIIPRKTRYNISRRDTRPRPAPRRSEAEMSLSKPYFGLLKIRYNEIALALACYSRKLGIDTIPGDSL
jgi:hypothetical protein